MNSRNNVNQRLLKEPLENSKLGRIPNNQEDAKSEQEHQTRLHHVFLNAVGQRFATQSLNQ